MAALGEILRAARQRKGVSLEEAETHTRVHRRYLEALEQSNYEALPARVYGKGFLRSYTGFLGLDEEELLDLLQREWPDPGDHKVEPETRYVNTPGTITGGMVVSFLVIVGICLLGYYLYQLYPVLAKNARSAPGVTAQATPGSSQATKPTAPPTSPTPAGTQTPPAAAPAPVTPRPDQIAVETKMVERSWVRVTTDDQVVFEGTLTQGTSQTWVAKEKIIVRTGNGAGVEVTFNGKKQGLMGSRGEVLEKQWTR